MEIVYYICITKQTYNMKNIIYILMSVTMLTSCVGVNNTINRAATKEGESFIKYGVEGHPDGVEVYKGSESQKTEAEIRRFNKQWERQESKARKEKEKEDKRRLKEVERQCKEVLKEYLKTCCNDSESNS